MHRQYLESLVDKNIKVFYLFSSRGFGVGVKFYFPLTTLIPLIPERVVTVDTTAQGGRCFFVGAG